MYVWNSLLDSKKEKKLTMTVFFFNKMHLITDKYIIC